ncbi:MAG TPA: GNAT family N-acetyltransferase [Candidatus Polarisedimenticolia bacterium]|nr:GNAT family N-acetyltransferase [Candidatus Polarisedimenticolia bacterium]
MTTIRLDGDCVLRSFERGDAASLARHGNNRRIWINLRDAFPHPYTEADGRAFISLALNDDPETHLAIVVDGEAAGAIGLRRNEDIERVSAEVGYWIGEPFWGRGIVTRALLAFTPHAIRAFGLSRLYALPFEWNHASFRVLEKSGYKLEGRLRRCAIKDGRIIDMLLYSYIVPE